MKFGLFYEHQIPRPWEEGAEQKLLLDALEQIELADRVGMHYVWEVEHHFLEEYSHSSAPEVFLAAASQRTRNIRLGHGIVQIPPGFNHPARVAERIATLDLISGGRVEFGTGESASQTELGGFGIDRALKHAQWEEALDAITRMFVEEPFAGFQGRFIWMPPRNVVPKPAQRPHPPLWMACSRRESILTAARKGIGALSFSFIEPEEAKAWVDDYYRIITSECTPAGFAVNPDLAVVVPFMCHPDEQTAIERGIDGAHFFGYSLAHYYVFGKHEPAHTNIWEEFLQNRNTYGFARDIVRAGDAPLGVRLLQEGIGSLRGAVGTPRQVGDLLARYEQAGVDAVIFVAQAGRNRHEHICESIELFAREVMPCFAEKEETRGKAKMDRLAAACEQALRRRAPARALPPGYVITSTGEPSTPPALAGGKRAAAQNSLFARMVRARDDRKLDRLMRFRLVQGSIFKGMRKAFHPERAQDFAAEVQYELKGAAGTVRWLVRIANGRIDTAPGKSANPMLTFRMSLPTFARIAAGEISPVTAMLERRLDVDGDIGKLAQFTELFVDR
ncbi:MAG TPA: LLM class flavin-dependent oxidoreductase [Bryobacteraceae bacterium]|nr:LLM class flavin-dependent oxidoreductase [Bryobacteraceae bacterium]